MDIIKGMLTYNAEHRLSIQQCLNHKWLTHKSQLTFSNVNKSKTVSKPKQLGMTNENKMNEDNYYEIKVQMDEFVDDNILKQGYLMKEGKLFKSWKKRWFVLNKNGVISYYNSHFEQEPIASFSIKNYIQIIKSKKINFAIIICTLDRNWKIVCSNDKNRNEWVNAFKIFKNTKNDANDDENYNSESDIFKDLLKKGVKCGAGDIWWIQKNCHSNNKYILKLQQHSKENEMVRFGRKVGFWSNHTDKYRIIFGKKQANNKYSWTEIHHSSKWDDIQGKYNHYKKVLLL